LGVFLKDFLNFAQYVENSQKPKKTNGFSLIFEVPGRIGGSKNHKKLKKKNAKRG